MTSTSYSTTVQTSLGTRSYRYPVCKCETVMQNFTSHWAAGQRGEPLLFGWPADVRNTGHKSHSRWGLGICSMQFLLPLVINLFQISGQPGQSSRVSDWTRQVTTARHRVSLPISISSSMDCGFSWSGPHTTVIIESYHQVVLHKLRNWLEGTDWKAIFKIDLQPCVTSFTMWTAPPACPMIWTQLFN